MRGSQPLGRSLVLVQDDLAKQLGSVAVAVQCGNRPMSAGSFDGKNPHR